MLDPSDFCCGCNRPHSRCERIPDVCGPDAQPDERCPNCLKDPGEGHFAKGPDGRWAYECPRHPNAVTVQSAHDVSRDHMTSSVL